MNLFRILFVFLALFSFEVWSIAAEPYHDPGGAFTVEIPDGWEVQRNHESAGWITLIGSDRLVAKVVILTNPVSPPEERPKDLRETILRELAKPHFTGWFAALKSQFPVEMERKVFKTTFLGSDALRMDVRYFRGDNSDPRRAYALFFFEGDKAFFVVPSGSPTGLQEANKVVSTIQIKPAKLEANEKVPPLVALPQEDLQAKEIHLTNAIGTVQNLCDKSTGNTSCLKNLRTLKSALFSVIVLRKLREWDPYRKAKPDDLFSELPDTQNIKRLRELLSIWDQPMSAPPRVEDAVTYAEYASEYLLALDTSTLEGKKEAHRILSKTLQMFHQVGDRANLNETHERLVDELAVALKKISSG